MWNRWQVSETKCVRNILLLLLKVILARRWSVLVTDQPVQWHGSSSTARFHDQEGLSPWLCRRSVSLCFNGHFPGGPGLAGTRMSPFWIMLEQRMMKVVVTTGAITYAKLQSNRHHTTNKPTPSFYRPDVLPVAQPIVSKLMVLNMFCVLL